MLAKASYDSLVSESGFLYLLNAFCGERYVMLELYRNNESGAVLPIILVIVFALTLIGIALLSYSLAETRHVSLDENNLKAHYIARSGAHAIAEKLIVEPEHATALINSSETDAIDFADGQFKVLVYGNPYDEVHVRSKGFFRNAVQTVNITLKEVGVDFALYAETVEVNGKAARISGGSVVYGESIDMDPVVLDDDQDIFHQPRNFDPVVLPCDDEESFPNYYQNCPTVNLDPYEGEVITVDSLYGDIILSGQLKHMQIEPAAGEDLLLKADKIDLRNNELTVKLNDNSVIIVVDDFRNTGNSRVYVEGDGFLMLYVQNYTGGGNFQLNPDSDVSVNVFVMEGGIFDLAGTPNFKGAIYAPDAAAVLFGNTSVTGWVIADEAEIGGNMRLYYSPIELGAVGLDLTFYRLDKWRYDD